MNAAVWVLTATLLGQSPADLKLLSVDSSRSVLGYDIVHRFHSVHGESRAVEGKVAIRPDGSAIVQVRVAVGSFNSGEANRDANMRETVGAAASPYVVLKGTAKFEAPA